MRRLAFLALAALAVSLAGCGGDGDRLSKEDYQQELAGIGATLESTFADVAAQLDGLNPDELSSLGDLTAFLEQASEQVGAGETALRNAADDLEAITPPEEVEETHQKMIEALRLLAADIGEFADIVKEGDLPKINAFVAGLDELESGKLIQEATEEFKERGYDIQGE